MGQRHQVRGHLMSVEEKLWLQRNINKTAEVRAKQEILKRGLSLPCKVLSVSGQLVTISFEIVGSPWNFPQITIPKAEDPYNMSPTQPGDFGVTISSDVYLGGISGQGGGTADFSRRGNLGATLLWMPVGNKSKSLTDPNIGQSLGPSGWVMGESGGNTLFANSTGTGASNGASGTFTNSSGNTLTIVNGIVTKIS